MTSVTDDGDYTISTSELSAEWEASDATSSVTDYQYAIGTTAGNTDVVGWTSTNGTASVTKTGLSLTSGQKHFFTVKAEETQPATGATA